MTKFRASFTETKRQHDALMAENEKLRKEHNDLKATCANTQVSLFYPVFCRNLLALRANFHAFESKTTSSKWQTRRCGQQVARPINYRRSLRAICKLAVARLRPSGRQRRRAR